MNTITFNYDFTFATIDGTEHRIDWFDSEDGFVSVVWLTDGRSYARGDTTDDTAWRQVTWTLHDSDTGEAIRLATSREHQDSVRSAETDGQGHIFADGRKVYVA